MCCEVHFGLSVLARLSGLSQEETDGSREGEEIVLVAPTVNGVKVLSPTPTANGAAPESDLPL